MTSVVKLVGVLIQRTKDNSDAAAGLSTAAVATRLDATAGTAHWFVQAPGAQAEWHSSVRYDYSAVAATGEDLFVGILA